MSALSDVKWYVASTHVHAEKVAGHHLRRQGFSVYLPLFRKFRSHARRKEWISKPLFPGYLFVGVNESNQRWRAINSTIGVRQLVSFSGVPSLIDETIISGLRKREDENGIVTLPSNLSFKKGESVKLMNGAFCEQIGLFDGIDEKMRVSVLLEFLGRQLRIKAPIEAVQSCS